MKNYFRLLVFAAAILQCAAFTVAADRTVVCAVLAERSGQSRASRLADLVEAKLTGGNNSLKLVERREIDAILKEHQLDRALAPEAVAERVTLAHLLKADLLIVLRDQTQPSAHVRLTICESAEGLRIANKGIGGSENPGVDVPIVESAVMAAIEKRSQRIDEICAIPPFVNLDLTHQYDSVLASYARVIEQDLLSRRGVLVVELAEARALATEIAIGGGRISRAMPLYFTGSCRNDGMGADRRVHITIAVARGEKQIANIDSGAIGRSAIASFLRSVPNRVLSQPTTMQPLAPDEEATILAKRVHEYFSLGQWKDAIAVGQASLLLAPQQPRVDRDIAATVSQLRQRRMFDHSRRADPSLEQITDDEMRDLYRMGLEHYRSYLRASRISYHDEFRLAREFLTFWPLEKFADVTLQDRQRELLGALRDKAHDRAPPDDTTLLLRDHIPWLAPGESLETAFDRKLQICRECADIFPNAAAMTWLFNLPEKPFCEDTPQRRAAVRALAAIDVPVCREAGAILQRRIDNHLPPQYDHAPPVAATAPAIASIAIKSDVLFTPMTLSWQDENGEPVQSPGNATSWISIDRETDAIKSYDAVWLIDAHRVARRIAKAGRTDALCWDGKFLWTFGPAGDPVIEIIDPHVGVVGRIGAAQSLPPVATGSVGNGFTEFLCAPIEPGKVCCAGYFDRTWIGVAEFKDRAPQFKVIYEASHTPGDGQDAWRDEKASFLPGYMLSIGKDAISRRILLGRADSGQSALYAHPLLIDPNTFHVEVMTTPINVHPNNPRVVEHDGAAWWMETRLRGPHPGALHTLRVGDPAPHQFEPSLPDGHLAFVDGRVHLLPNHEKEWFVAPAPEGPFQKLSADIPMEIQFRAHLYPSTLFGLVLVPDNRIEDGKIYQVSFPTLAASK